MACLQDLLLVDLQFDPGVAPVRKLPPLMGGQAIRFSGVEVVAAHPGFRRAGFQCRLPALAEPGFGCAPRVVQEAMSALRTSPSSTGVKLWDEMWMTRRPLAISLAMWASTWLR